MNIQDILVIKNFQKLYWVKFKMYILICKSPVVITGGIKTQRPNRPQSNGL